MTLTERMDAASADLRFCREQLETWAGNLRHAQGRLMELQDIARETEQQHYHLTFDSTDHPPTDT